MVTRWHLGAVLVALPLALAAGCGDRSQDRSALSQDEMDRELELAISEDSAPPATFQDTALGVQPEVEPEAPRQPSPQPSPRPSPRQREREPAPTPTPRATQPEADPEPVLREPRAVTATAGVGTTFAVTLNETLSTQSNRVGDMFTATLQAPIRSADGELVVPAGAVIRGRLTQVDKSGGVGQTGVIALAFESISFDGRSLPLDGTVVKANPQRKSRTSVQSTAGKVAVGAAAGAVLGRVIGKDTKGTIAGAVIGAAAGTAIAMGTADVDVVLPAGSDLMIRLDSPIEVRTTS
jgi:hypothetical protein